MKPSLKPIITIQTLRLATIMIGGALALALATPAFAAGGPPPPSHSAPTAIATISPIPYAEASAIVFIQGVPGLIQTAVDAAFANGATAEQLQPLIDLGTALDTQTSALVAALQPPAPPVPNP